MLFIIEQVNVVVKKNDFKNNDKPMLVNAIKTRRRKLEDISIQLIKMEQMWSGHLLKFVDSPRTNPKSIIINSYLACVSGNRSFAINNRNQQNIRILMVEFDHLILTFYLIEPILAEGMESSVQELINMISVGQC
ncbi:hypothetical protein [Sphingobacterium siyangense]|uniref:hypothetical protein n=1 Tax=Sphingobacterium siyangense TaxID=459529 RepID=UPI001962769A|nr:hypothetical protein [Sphingobacterium siyangense]QRY57026.1 hypothetical protein JVX97_24010 [Sphingobacterium siyangense]